MADIMPKKRGNRSPSPVVPDRKFRKHYEAYELPVKLAVEIAALRQKKRLTQAQLARRMGVQQQMVAQLENPGETVPNVRTLEKVARALGKQLHIAFR